MTPNHSQAHMQSSRRNNNNNINPWHPIISSEKKKKKHALRHTQKQIFLPACIIWFHMPFFVAKCATQQKARL